MADHDYVQGGIRPKYTITKTDGTPLEPDARYFVLRYDGDHDPCAHAAIRAYARAVQPINTQLADELVAELAQYSVDTTPPAIPVPYRTFCAKCHGKELKVSYCSRETQQHAWPTDACRIIAEEHLHTQCTRCGHAWAMRCADSPQITPPAAHAPSVWTSAPNILPSWTSSCSVPQEPTHDK
jgi:hypothetical protein